MLNQLSLSSRGTILATTPLVALTILMTILIMFLCQIQDAASRELNSKELLNQAQLFVRELGKNINLTLSDRHSKPGKSGGDQGGIETKMDAFCDSCESAGQPRPELMNLRSAARRLSQLTVALETNADNMSDQARHDMKKRLLAESAYVFDILNSVQRFHSKRLTNESQNIEQLQNKILVTLVSGLLGSLLLAVLLAQLYATGIKRPLARIAENSRLLSLRQPLLPPVRGNNEFSKLDQLLHVVDVAVGEALAREHSLVNNAADLICSVEPSGLFSRVSPYSQKMLGYTESELVGRSVLEITVGEDAHFASEQFAAAASESDSGESTSTFDLRLARKDANVLDTRWSAFWSDSEKKLFCVVHDITEQRIVEQLREDFLTVVSQDLRTPLLSMQTSIQNILKSAVQPNPHSVLPLPVVQEVSMIDTSIESLTCMLNDLLDFQKLKSGRFVLDQTECELEQLINAAIGLMQATAESKQVGLRSTSGNWKITADSARLSQVLANLLANAIRFSPSGSTVEVIVSEEPEAIEIDVADNGPGIAVEYRDRVFEAFEQLPNTTQGGSGLGLAICKAMVEAHGGAIGVRSNEPNGSIFWIRLPKK